MKPPLNILHLEDDPKDAARIQSTLEAGGVPCAISVVQNHDDFVAALDRSGYDLILLDISLPAFDGISAWKIAHARLPDLPVILVSGALGEEMAVGLLQSGFTDYVLKQHLSRLVPAVHRAMKEVEERAESRRLAAQFIESQKMDVIGQLAGGIAHDFNNILAVIMGYSDLMMQKLAPDDPLRKHVVEIRKAGELATGLTRQLLIFTRKQKVQPIVADLNDVVKDMEQLLQRLINENIELRIALAPQIGRIKADPGYLRQALMNLAVNARDAMPNGGVLTITTNNVTPDEKQRPPHLGASPGHYVMLSVSDTGVGITDEVKARLFEPLFTTKPKGKGTGLGLATCQSIVEQSGGHITVSSQAGKGATFSILFPSVELPLDVTTRQFQAGPLPRGSESVLVVEDDPSVRHLACGALQALGYDVLSASNGRDALRVASEHKGSPIRLVVADVIMPLMSGKVMAEWLKATYPNLRVLFTSGYTDDAIAQQGVFDPGVAFLPKPYSSASLARMVRKMLDDS